MNAFLQQLLQLDMSCLATTVTTVRYVCIMNAFLQQLLQLDVCIMNVITCTAGSQLPRHQGPAGRNL